MELCFKKAILISRHHPPHVSGGARRSAQLLSGLRKLIPNTLLVSPAELDDPLSITVEHKCPEPSPRKISENPMRTFVRGSFLIPDPDIIWARKVYRKILPLVGDIDLIVTTAPPESIHWVGNKLLSATGAKWIADFRDSWLHEPLLVARENKFRQFRERRWAKKNLATASLALAVDQRVATDIQNILNDSFTIRILPQFAEKSEKSDVFNNGKRNVVHTGSFQMSDPNRDIADTLAIFQNARKLNENLHLHLLGHLAESELELVSRYQVNGGITVHGAVPLEESRRFQSGADLGIVVTSLSTTAVPGKVYEYHAANLPFVVIGNPGWLGDKLLQKHDIIDIIAGHKPAGTEFGKSGDKKEFCKKLDHILQEL